MNADEFNIDFDFEKEYGYDAPEEELETMPEPQVDEEFDLDAFLAKELGTEFDSDYEAQPAAAAAPDAEPEDDLNLEDLDFDVPDFRSQEPAFEVDEPDFDFEREYEPVPETEPVADLNADEIPQPIDVTEVPADEDPPAAPARRRKPRPAKKSQVNIAALLGPVVAFFAPAPPKPEVDSAGRRRKPRSKARRFKDDQLPLIIAAAAVLVCLIFIIGSISRSVSSFMATKESEAQAASEAAQAELLLQQEAQSLIAEAQVMAMGYDYQGAIDLLNTYSGTALTSEMEALQSQYTQTMSTLIEWKDPNNIPNLSFHVLIADPSRAFKAETYAGSYNKNFVTIDEFSAILEQLYSKGYVLVGLDDVVAEVVDGDSTSYTPKTIALPDGKKPIMITETMVNYFSYMVDPNNDGNHADNSGFASRLVLQNGEVKAEMVDASGTTVVGNYDLVPILNDFIKEHPDFCYRGARAILAVCGYDGVFGYRGATLNDATAVVDALRADGYDIACYTYDNIAYAQKTANEIKADIDKWTSQIVPVIGEVDIMVFAKSSDISTTGGNYSGSKFTTLTDAGFRYFIGSNSNPSALVNTDYVRQGRIQVTGTQMANNGSIYANYFDAASVLNSTRGDVPHN